MKPKPFASLNHLTVPFCLILESPFCDSAGGRFRSRTRRRLVKQSLDTQMPTGHHSLKLHHIPPIQVSDLHRAGPEALPMAAAKAKQLDAITLLKTDHKKVRLLLETLDKTDAPARRTKLFDQI